MGCSWELEEVLPVCCSRALARSLFLVCDSFSARLAFTQPLWWSPRHHSFRGTYLGCDLCHFQSVWNIHGALNLSVTRVDVSLLLIVCFYICLGYFQLSCSNSGSSHTVKGGGGEEGGGKKAPPRNRRAKGHSGRLGRLAGSLGGERGLGRLCSRPRHRQALSSEPAVNVANLTVRTAWTTVSGNETPPTPQVSWWEGGNL